MSVTLGFGQKLYVFFFFFFLSRTFGFSRNGREKRKKEFRIDDRAWIGFPIFSFLHSFCFLRWYLHFYFFVSFYLFLVLCCLRVFFFWLLVAPSPILFLFFFVYILFFILLLQSLRVVSHLQSPLAMHDDNLRFPLCVPVFPSVHTFFFPRSHSFLFFTHMLFFFLWINDSITFAVGYSRNVSAMSQSSFPLDKRKEIQ